MIALKVVGVRVELPTNQPIILLKEDDGERYLPIFIGPVEATAIAFGMQGLVSPRPQTHDLFRDVVQALGTQVQRVLITELREGTFYAELQMLDGDKEVNVSSRPSDAIALAVRLDVPIFANEQVLDEAAIVVKDDDEQEVEKFKEFLDQVTPEDFRQ